MRREQTGPESRAAEEFADAVRDGAERFFVAVRGEFLEAVRDEMVRNPEALRLVPLSEKEADELALAAVHLDRREHPREPEEPPPGEDEVRSWSEERRRRERGSGRPGT